MSNSTAGTEKLSKNSNLPQFMSNKTQQASTTIEEQPSWLANNLNRLMIGVSAAWFAIVLIYITQFFGWSNLFLMMPDEFGGFLAGVTLPLAIIWVVMAYIDRGTSFKQEAKFLRAYMNQLVYPEQGAPQTAKAMADAIRSQVVELQDVTSFAMKETAKIKDEMGSNIQEFSKLVATLDTYSSKTLVEMSEGVKFLIKNFETISSKAELSTRAIANYNQEFIDGTKSLENNLADLFEKLLPRIKELKTSAQLLQEISETSNNDILRANELIVQYNNESQDNLKRVNDALSNQITVLRQVSEKAIEDYSSIQTSVHGEVNELNSVITEHVSKMDSIIKEQSNTLKGHLKELSEQAMEGCDQINSNVGRGLETLENSINKQIQKFAGVAEKQSHEWQDNIRTLSEQTDAISSKLTMHSATIAQEIDKLSVRSNNLEESIAMQVSGLSEVAENVSATLQKTDEMLATSVVSLQEKSEQANADINSYMANLEDKAAHLEEVTSAILEKSVQVSEDISKRHSNLTTTFDYIDSRIDGLNKEIGTVSDNVKSHVEDSINRLDEVIDTMNKHAVSLTETSSVVVSQSQISEAALAQQQRNIASSANRVEEIKAELKRQIEDITKASSALEGNASEVVEKMKTQLENMLSSCNKVIEKSRAINDNIEQQADKFDVSTNKTLAKVVQLENVLTSQSNNMNNLSKDIQTRTQEIDKILSRQTQEISKATEDSENVFRLLTDSFENQNVAMRTLSQEASNYVSGVVQSLDDKAAALGVLFRQQENELREMGDELTDKTSAMSEALKKQISVLEQNTSKVMSKMETLEKDTATHSEAVINSSSRSIEKLSEVEDKLNEKNILINSLIHDITKNLDTIASNIQDKTNQFSSTVKGIKEEVSNSTNQILENCDKIQSAENVISKESASVSKLMDEQLKNIDVTLVKAKLQADDIRQMFEQQKDNLTDIANTLATQTRLGEASLAQQYKYLSDAAVDVAQKVNEISEGFKSNTDNIFDTATKIAYEFDVLGDRLIKAGEDVQKTSKNSTKSIEQVNMSLSQCGEELDAAINHSVQNIGGVFKEYEKYLAGFNTVTAETSTGVIEINNLISEQSDKMIQISEDTKKLVDCFNTVLNETSTALSNRANMAYDKVKGLGENLKNLGTQLEEATKISAAHFENSGDKLRATITEISTNAERISNEIRSSGEVFLKQSGALVAVTDDTLNKVHSAMESLANTGQDFSLKGSEVIKQSIRFNDIIDTQVKLLSEQAQKADTTLNRLMDSYQGIQIDTFLKNASDIIERMQTMSVDINRIFNAKDEDDLWKRYYNGDASIFVRYLARNMTKQQISAVRKSFEKDMDFRKLVTGYLSEFETLIEHAKANERSGVLLSVISGADIGKLYYILAKALDKVQ